MKTLKQRERSISGFTLVELVITIAIVIILSVISVPIYRGYVDKAKMSEAYALFGVILSAQKAYFSEYGNFLYCKDSSAGEEAWTNNETILGIDARGNKYFTWFHIGGHDITQYYFRAGIRLTDDLKLNNSNELALQFNITKGTKDIGLYDSSWK